MVHERILDIGIGSGGTYITTNTAPYEQRFGLDIDQWALRPLHSKYPCVLPVQSSAEHLPFAANSFSRIEIVLPHLTLMVPGLQKDHFALIEAYRELYAQIYPHGWYPEFHRVLKPKGDLIIYGDIWVDPKMVQKTSQQFFTVEHIQPLSETELKELGIYTVPLVIDNIKKHNVSNIFGKNAKDSLVKMHLRSKTVI